MTEMINRILVNREYMGDTVLGRTCMNSKGKKIDKPKHEWKIFENKDHHRLRNLGNSAKDVSYHQAKKLLNGRAEQMCRTCGMC